MLRGDCSSKASLHRSCGAPGLAPKFAETATRDALTVRLQHDATEV
jgi:hypothetical protein